MDKIWTFFENMNEFVYVTDMDTYEIVYMNKQAREIFGIHTAEDLLGRKCYEMLQGNSIPCAFCNNHELKPACFKEWRYYNPVIGKHLFLRDSMIEEDGRRLRIELALDISAQEMRERAFLKYHDFEKIVNTALRTALYATTPDESINIVLEYIGKALQGDRPIFLRKINGAATTIRTNGLPMAWRRKKRICRMCRRMSARAGIGIFRRVSILLLRIWRISGKKIR